MTSSIEDIQKLLTLMAYIAEKALYLAGQSLFGRRQDAFGEIEKKHSQLIRLRKELEEQVSTHIGAELPTGRDVKRLLLITRLGGDLEALARQALAASQAARGVASPDKKPLKEFFQAYDEACNFLARSLAVLIEKAPLDHGKAARALVLGQQEASLATAKLSRRETHAAAEGKAALVPLFVVLREIIVQTSVFSAEIVEFLAEMPPGPDASGDRRRGWDFKISPN